MGRSRGRVLAFAVLAGATLGAGQGGPARVVDVRIGEHAGLTRVVIELDTASRHSIERQPEKQGSTLEVRLGARAERRRIVSRSRFVESVSVVPEDGGSVTRIALREPKLEYSEMLLDSPPRIVIDVHRPSVARSGAKGTATPLVATSERSPASSRLAADESPATRRPDADPASAAQNEAERAERPAPPGSYRALVAEQQHAAALAPPPDAAENTDTAQRAVAQGVPPASAAAATTPPPLAPNTAPDRGPEAAMLATHPTDRPDSAARPSPAPSEPQRLDAGRATTSPADARAAREATAPPAVATGPSSLNSRLRRIDAGSVLLALAVLAGVAIVYRRASVRRTQRRALTQGEDALAVFGDGVEPAPDDTAAAASGESPHAGAPALVLVRPAEDPGAPEPVAPEDAPSHGWQTLSVPPPEPELAAHALESSPVAASALASLDPASGALPAAAAPLDESRTAELARRIEALESRIAELLEARERLERFAAAQNEELRVQRAAIARTQRILRGISRPEDTASDGGTQPPLPLSGD